MSFTLEDVELTDEAKRDLEAGAIVRLPWVKLEVLPEDWEWAEQHLEAVRATGYRLGASFGNAIAGFAAERVLARFLDACGVPYTWYNDTYDRREDFEICGQAIDLKTQCTAGAPQIGYDVDITRETAMSARGDTYLFAKINRQRKRDLWLLGFQGHEEYMQKAVFYREGDRTRTGMEAPWDCYCVRYNELMPWEEWVGMNEVV